MPLDEHSLLSQLIATQDQPDGTTVSAAEIDDYIRQVKGFLIRFLAKAHNDDGTLKDDVSVLSFSDISGKVQNDQVEPDAIESVHISDDAILSRHIEDDQVLGAHIKDGEIVAAHLANDAVTNDKILDATISADKLAGDIPYSKLASSTGSTIVDDSIEASKIKCPTGASATIPNLIAVMDAAANSKIAKIGGVLTGSLNNATTPPTLEFAFQTAIDTAAGGIAIVAQDGVTNTVNLVTGWQHRKGWVAVRDGGIVTIGSTAGSDKDKIILSTGGTYVVLFMLSAYGTCACGTSAYFDSKLEDADGTEIGASTTARLATTAPETALWVFGAAQFNVGESGLKIHFESLVTDAGGTWYEGINAAPNPGRAGICLIIPVT